MKQSLLLLLLVLVLLSSCTLKLPGSASEDGGNNSEARSNQNASSDDWVPNAPFAEKSTKDNATEEVSHSEKESSESSEEVVPPLTQKLVIPEGYTLARVGMTLQEMGICTTAEFIEATLVADFSEYPLIAASGIDPNRAFPLEGYLFPDTYEIYTDESLDSIIRRFLSHTETKISGEIRTAIEESEFNSHQILTLASIIEKEAFGKAEMPKISSVLHNRLEEGMKLECDVTIVYVEGAIKPFIDGDPNRYNEYYNTYKAAGLPAGPICNPSIDAIWAALEPAETTYLFFLTDEDKNYYYAEDYEIHKENEITAGIRSSDESAESKDA